MSWVIESRLAPNLFDGDVDRWVEESFLPREPVPRSGVHGTHGRPERSAWK